MTTPITPFERCMQPQPVKTIDWLEEMDRLAERDAMRRQAEAQERWILEYRSKLFKNVHDYPKVKK